MITSKIRTLVLATLLGISGMVEAQTFTTKLPTGKHQWASAKRNSPFTKHASPFAKHNAAKRAANQNDTQLGPVNSFGTLYGPDGSEWIYTSVFDFDDNGSYTAAHIKIYDSQNKLLGSIDNEFTLGEHQTGINSVMIDPNVTKKFFNVNDKYEVILFIHATTDDYQGYTYQKVFSLEPDQTEPLLTIPGYEVLTANMAADQFSENVQMIMMREEITEDNIYYIYYDVYERAGWGSTNAPKLIHTFKFNYTHIAGSGGSATPVTVQNIGGKAHYAISYYEKPCFDQDVPYWEDPVQTPDNNLIVELYNTDSFNVKEGEEVKPYKSMKIPVELEEGYLYTFPGIGSLMGNDDFSLGLFGDKNTPYFIITNDNYESLSDEFRSSFYVYDSDGNRVKTIATGVHDYLRLADIQGQDIMFCFTDDNALKFNFVQLPSCETVGEVPYTVEERLLSTAIDRVPAGSGFNYVIAGSNGESDSQGNIFHPVGYFNEDGSTNHWDLVNLGKDVQMAQPAIIAEWLNPYLFNTDNAREYMFLVKLLSPESGSTQAEEHLWIVKTNGEILADYGPDETMGVLNSISITNATADNPALSVAYYDWEKDLFMLSFTSLPITKFAGGNGTEADPYVIANAGDLMQIAKAPAAYYIVANDIDCDNYPMGGNKCDFTGNLDGQKHNIKNLNLVGSSLLGNLIGAAQVKNITFLRPSITPQGSCSAIVGTEAHYDGTTAPAISNVYVLEGEVANADYDGIFGTFIGKMTTGSTISASAASDTYIELPKATVGGIAGEINASGANIYAVAFTGTIDADIAGGVVGTVTNGNVHDAHVNAAIFGSTGAGGVVGEIGEYSQNRGSFVNCFVEGTIESTNTTDANLGGIAGNVVPGTNKCITNNFVALDEIKFDGSVKSGAHRIVGHTCADELGEILWEDPWWDTFEGDPYEHPELWPRAAVQPDAGFENNYAISPAEPVNGDAKMAEDHTSVEGKTVIETGEELRELFVAQGFLFGDDVENPWVWTNGKPSLWFESDELTGIESATSPCIMQIKAGQIVADGIIEVYSVSGAKVATSTEMLRLSSLPAGVYVAKSGSKTVKFIIK